MFFLRNKSFNFRWCSPLHIGRLHFALGTWHLRDFVVRIWFVTFKTHREIIVLLFQCRSGHVFAAALAFDSRGTSGGTLTNICTLTLPWTDSSSRFLSTSRPSVCIRSCFSCRLVSNGSYIAWATTSSTESFFAKTGFRTCFCHPWITSLPRTYSNALRRRFQ